MTIAAELVGTLNQKSRRRSARREMKLRARGASGPGEAKDVVIRNLSTTGMLLEAAVQLAVGQKITLDLPQIGHASAEIVWAGEELFGCAFDRPLSEAAVSAAQLRSEPQSHSNKAPFTETANANRSPQSLGENIRGLRLARGLSLVEFARKMQVSRPTVWSWEGGKSSTRAKKRQQELKVLEATESQLQGSADLPARIEPREEPLSGESTLKSVVEHAKMAIAIAAGTTPEKVTLIIEI